MTRPAALFLIATLGLGLAGCRKQPPVATPATPAPFPTAGGGNTAPPPPPVVVPEPPPVPMEPAVTSSAIDNMAIDEINRNSPLKPVFFALDSDQLDDPARTILNENAEVLKRYATWVITIEGHTDERGSAEYNLALGERRATAARTYLLSLGIAPDRLRTVSYGKEFPFDPASNESAWEQNRRAHFMLTAK
jgi:peptidoglycan-associated lipoprotein